MNNFLFNNFCYRKDAYCLMKEHPWQRDKDNKKRLNYYDRVFEPLTLELIDKHLSGEITLAVFPTDIATQTVSFICWDVDIDNKIVLDKFILLASRVGGKLLIEKSGGINRFHIWVLFDKPITLKEARSYNEYRNEHGVDFFPNKDVVINDFYCELPIKLPLGYHKKSRKWSSFITHNILENV